MCFIERISEIYFSGGSKSGTIAAVEYCHFSPISGLNNFAVRPLIALKILWDAFQLAKNKSEALGTIHQVNMQSMGGLDIYRKILLISEAAHEQMFVFGYLEGTSMDFRCIQRSNCEIIPA